MQMAVNTMGIFDQRSASLAPPANTVNANDRLHRDLARRNQGRLSPGIADADWEAELARDFSLRKMEIEFVESERREVASQLIDLPADVDGFMAWFEALRETGPGQHDPLFDWLAEQASMPQMRWFLAQEVAGEAGFDDLVALTQLRLPPRPKLELARNYWDEMGRGNEDGMHGPMLAATAEEFSLASDIDSTVWEALALANMMVALAAQRRYAYQSIGALGVVELTAPGRVSKVNEGLRRLGVSVAGRRYFQLHAGLDVRHSLAWNQEVIRPLITEQPQTAKLIAEGALLRLRCGMRCFARYRQELFEHGAQMGDRG